MLTYGGIPLVAPTGELLDWAYTHISWDYLFDLARPLAPTPPLLALGWPWQRRARPPKPSCLYWPGYDLSRPAVAYFFASDAQVQQLPAPGTSASLVFNDGVRPPLSVTLWLLPVRPLSANPPPSNNGNLITLVDRRFFLNTGGALTLAPGTTSWATLCTDLADILGITFSQDSIPAAYLSPPADFAASYENGALLLDAACRSIGQRVVANLDGTYFASNAGTAATAETTNRSSIVNGIAAGGFINSPTAALPGSLTVAFPEVDTSSGFGGNYFAVTNSLGGGPGNLTIKSSAVASSTGGSVVNTTELNALAAQLAADTRSWGTADADVAYSGVALWNPTGREDLEWLHSASKILTRVQRPPWNEFPTEALAFSSQGSLSTSDPDPIILPPILGIPTQPPAPGSLPFGFNCTTGEFWVWACGTWWPFCPCYLPFPSGASGLPLVSGSGGTTLGVFVPCCPNGLPTTLCVTLEDEGEAPACLAGTWTLTWNQGYGVWYLIIPASANCCPSNDIMLVLCCYDNGVGDYAWQFSIYCAAPGRLPAPSCGPGNGALLTAFASSVNCSPPQLIFDVPLVSSSGGNPDTVTTSCGTLPTQLTATFSNGTGNAASLNSAAPVALHYDSGLGSWVGDVPCNGESLSLSFFCGQGEVVGAHLWSMFLGLGFAQGTATGPGGSSPVTLTTKSFNGRPLTGDCSGDVTITVTGLNSSSCACLDVDGGYHITVMRCASGGGGGGGGSVATPCCPENGIPATLNMNISGANALQTIDGNYPLTLDTSAGSPAWRYNGPLGSCTSAFFSISCSVNNTWAASAGNGGPLNVHPNSASCNPFKLVFDFFNWDQCGGNAVGTVTITG